MSDAVPAGNATAAPAPEAVPTPSTDAPAAGTPQTETATDTASLDPAALAQEVAKWKALSRKNEDQARANAEKAREFDALKDSEKTDLQRAQDELARIQGELESTRGDALRNSVAAAKGVPANLLAGKTKEELEAVADALLAFKGTSRVPAQDAAASVASGQPVTNAGTQITSIDGMSRAEINEAREAGRLDALLGRTK